VREILELEVAEVVPGRTAVLASQGIPRGAELPPLVRTLFDRAMESFEELAAPRAVLQSISLSAFAEVYEGEGNNAPETPLAGIYPAADHLALFAATAGAELSAEIGRLFDEGELAAAVMLDSVASEGAEILAARIAELFASRLASESAGGRTAVLPYSPGYCGWHVSGQRRLFGVLEPEEIGITLNASCLMQPLKSVSGVLVAGAPSIHDFDDAFDFCAQCTTRECRGRIAEALEG
jgi:hypothetical protein